jgi:hypothetical protein
MCGMCDLSSESDLWLRADCCSSGPQSCCLLNGNTVLHGKLSEKIVEDEVAPV